MLEAEPGEGNMQMGLPTGTSVPPCLLRPHTPPHHTQTQTHTTHAYHTDTHTHTHTHTGLHPEEQGVLELLSPPISFRKPLMGKPMPGGRVRPRVEPLGLQIQVE